MLTFFLLYMRWICLGLLFWSAQAYLKELFEPEFWPQELGISDDCILYASNNRTILHFHDERPPIETNRTSTVRAMNQDCSTILFGYPAENKVVRWNPFESDEVIIRPNVNVSRFGFSLDIQNQSWVVGAPGNPNNKNGQGNTMGYAFVYHGTELHSCRSLYDSYCYPFSTECATGFKNMKDYYGQTDETVPAFQKQCMSPQLPYYATGPLDPVRVPYFVYQQFGYAVALSGQLGQRGSALFISAPGDTNRFMEDNRGENYGRVYMWDSVLWDPNDEALDTITWWQPSVYTPLIPPNLPTLTYRGFGRALAASRATLAVTTYPLYDMKKEPFVIVYDCDPGLTTYSHCQESGGISVNDLPGNVLGYFGSKEMAYTDGKTAYPYIPADTVGDGLDDFQNNFIGKEIGVTGSNIIIPDDHNNKVYRYGKDSEKRETHPFLTHTSYGTNTQHWIHGDPDFKLTHLWNCPLGHIGPAHQCTPCSTSYFSDDGWLEECDPCARNFTTNQTGQSVCIQWHPPVPTGLLWGDAVTIMIVIVASAVGLYGIVVACQFCCPARRPRYFTDK